MSAEHFGGELECGNPAGGLKLCPITGDHRRAWDWMLVVVEIALAILTTKDYVHSKS